MSFGYSRGKSPEQGERTFAWLLFGRSSARKSTLFILHSALVQEALVSACAAKSPLSKLPRLVFRDPPNSGSLPNIAKAAAATTLSLTNVSGMTVWKVKIEKGDPNPLGRRRERINSRTFSRSPEGQLISLRKGKTVVEIKFSSTEKANPLETKY